MVPEELSLSASNDNLIVMEKKNAGRGQEICVIYSTVPPARSADLAQRLLEKDLVACVNILPVRSMYRWKGESCDDEEHLLIMKTRKSLADEVMRALKDMHPYDVPEIIVLPVTAGYAQYLDWVQDQTERS
jgi:periplasmic divalent cation tolerance protein